MVLMFRTFMFQVTECCIKDLSLNDIKMYTMHITHALKCNKHILFSFFSLKKEIWAGKYIKCSEICMLFCGSLECNTESNMYDKG